MEWKPNVHCRHQSSIVTILAYYVDTKILRKELLNLVEQKLSNALKEIDVYTQEQARDAWHEIGPTPLCSSVDVVMKAIHESIARGYRDRERIAKETIVSTLAPLRSVVSTKFIEEVMSIVTNLFPSDTYLAIVQNTPDVYKRALAPNNKFNQCAFELEASLITVSAQNYSRQSIASIRTALKEMALQESIANPPWWKRIHSVFWEFIGLPFVKWVFGIITAIIVAMIIYKLGIN